MPIYEYVCNSCNKKFDQLVGRMSAADEESAVACPACGSKKTARALSVFAVGERGAPKAAAAPDVPMCGRCGGPEGSCGMD